MAENSKRKRKSYPEKYPELDKIYSQNNVIPFKEFTNEDAISNRNILWVCNNCGKEYEHTYRFMKKNMTNLDECCPYCHPNKSRIAVGESFAEVHPELLAEYSKSNNVSPYSVKPYSKKEVVWICPEGHEWTGTFASRHRGKNCPVCANKNSLQNLFINIYRQFSPNNDAAAEKITADSTAKYL